MVLPRHLNQHPTGEAAVEDNRKEITQGVHEISIYSELIKK